MSMKLVVVGNGMVGQRFLEQVTARMSSDALDVTVFCEEPRAAYDRVQLTSFFAGKSAIDLTVVPARFFEDRAITLRLNDRVVAIDRAARTCAPAATAKCRTTSSCSPPARFPSCRRFPAGTAAAASSIARSKTSK